MRSRSEASGEAGPQKKLSVWGGGGGARKTRPWGGWGGGGGGGVRGGGAPDKDLGLRGEGGGEEDEALDVVEVEVGEEDVEPGRLVGLGQAEAADAGAGVERQHRAVREGDADAGGVAAVADR